MNLLAHPLVTKYFSVNAGSIEKEQRYMAERILQAMQGQLKPGDKVLQFSIPEDSGDGFWEEQEYRYASLSYLGDWHPVTLRLPDQFQSKPETKKECCEYKKYREMVKDGSIAKLCASHYVAIQEAVKDDPGPGHQTNTFFAPTGTGVKDVWTHGDPVHERKEQTCEESGCPKCKPKDEVNEKIQDIREFVVRTLNSGRWSPQELEALLDQLVELARKHG